MYEVWKDIDGYEGIYQVSNCGEVRNIQSGKLKIPQKRPNGYLFVVLYKNGLCHSFNIHRLVAKAHVDNPCGYQIVNHKDENKRNNNAVNLEWCTQSYNSTYGHARDRVDAAHRKPVVQMSLDGKVIAYHRSAVDAAIAVGGKHRRANISNVCLGNSQTAYGYKWKFLKEEIA